MTRHQIIEALSSAKEEKDQTIRMSVQFRDEVIRELMPEPAEWEGGGSNWFYVCPECHVNIKQGTRFCMSCGKEILWK